MSGGESGFMDGNRELDYGSNSFKNCVIRINKELKLKISKLSNSVILYNLDSVQPKAVKR